MKGPLADLGVPGRVWAAPMSGGPTTPAVVVAAGRAGSLGFLAGGYKTVVQLADQIRQVRAQAPVFGVNLFAPNPVPVDPAEYRAYAEAIGAPADDIREDDDQWHDKIDLLTDVPVPVVSFTFGIPGADVIRRLHRAGTIVVQTVTSRREAEQAAEAGMDALAVQGHQAGGHYATLTPSDPATWPDVPLEGLVTQIKDVLPVVAAGGIASGTRAREVLAAGAEAVAVGTYLLRTDESGASATYKAALLDRRHAPTRVTRAFSGRPARGIENGFMVDFDRVAPLGYPAIHHLTTPMRRRAAESGDADRINLWAGTAHAAMAEGSVADALAALEADL